jgi:hypothetical protein
MVRGRACALVACGVAAAAAAFLGLVNGASASVTRPHSPVRVPHCSEPPRVPQPDVSYLQRGYRQVVLNRSWLRVGTPVGIGRGPGDPGGGCGPLVCTPFAPPPEYAHLPPVSICTWQGRPPTPGPAVAVSRLRAFPPAVALSRGGSSRVILVAQNLCRFASERLLLRCLRAA